MTLGKISHPVIAGLPLVDSSFTASFLAIRNLGAFYGTDAWDTHEGFMDTVKNALQSRIAEPVVKWVRDPKTCFFKPYDNKQEGLDGCINGFVNPLFAVLAGLGILGDWASHPAMLVMMFCSPAIIELLAGFFGLIHGLCLQAKFCYSKDDEVQQEAISFFLDAGTRLVLVIPLAMVCLIAAPFECVRYFTRAISTIIDAMPNRQTVEEETQHLAVQEI